MWEKFTPSAKRIIKYAHEEAKHFRSAAVDTEHVLLGLIRDKNSGAMKALMAMDADIELIQNATIKAIELDQFDVDALNFSREAKNVLEAGFREARKLKKNSIGSEHLLLGLLVVESGKACRILNENGVTYEDATKVIGAEKGMHASHKVYIKPPPNFGVAISMSEIIAETVWDKFTPTAQECIADAYDEAKRCKSKVIGTEHLLLSLLRRRFSGAVRVLNRLKIEMYNIRADVLKAVEGEKHDIEIPDFGFDLLQNMDAAFRAAHTYKKSMIGTEHLLLGMLMSEEGKGFDILSVNNVGFKDVSEYLTRVTTGPTWTDRPRVKPDQVKQHGISQILPPKGFGRLFDWNIFTPGTQRIINHAYHDASHLHSNSVTTDHILLGILREKNSIAIRVLRSLEVDLESLKSEVIDSVAKEQDVPVELNLSGECKKVFDKISKERGRIIRSVDFLLGIIQDEDCLAHGLLEKKQLTVEKINDALRQEGIISLSDED